MIIGKRESLCDMCDKKIEPGTECFVNKEGYCRKQLKLCHECTKDLKAWQDTIDDYMDELEEY